ncbi:ABC transporter ATP-binding protein [Amycolatopsis nigrescens]|uniref:ABC transporter ATP-binding protein n=1 Tax=Amycolatopsis nigrescens TaxID=381445 RepID=UPI00037F0D18|nr:ABC transporter ATP-binding protein [Amycolatopsis nigrescens]
MNTVLDIRSARHSYGETVALDGVDLTVGAGECVVLLGPNGAGKTTLVNLSIGLLGTQQGEIRVAGGDPRVAATRHAIGVVQQSLGFPNTLKVGELVAGAAVRGGRERAAAGPVLTELELAGLAKRRATKLSGGQKQRLQLAMALVTEPALLVLDEPTAGLDVPARRRLWQTLAQRRARGAGVLVTTHLIEESAAVADRVVVLDRGRVLAAGRPDELIARLPDRTVVAETRLGPDRLARLTGVLSVHAAGRLVRLRTREPEALLRDLLTADPELTGLRVEDAGLEEAVVSLIEEGVAA